MSIGDDMWADLFRLLENLGLSEDDGQAIADLTGDIEHQAVAEAREPLVVALREASALLPDATAYAAACGQLADAAKMDNSDLAIPASFILRCRSAIANAAAALAAKEPP